MKLSTLKKQASQATSNRGHKMQWEKPFLHWRGPIQNAACKHCGMEVQCQENPGAQDIDIGGTAVALNCTR
jgi:transcription elongation factor Elf1